MGSYSREGHPGYLIWEAFHFVSSASPFMNVLLYNAVESMRCVEKRGALAPCCLLAGEQARCCFKLCVLDRSAPSDADVCLPSRAAGCSSPSCLRGTRPRPQAQPRQHVGSFPSFHLSWLGFRISLLNSVTLPGWL